MGTLFRRPTPNTSIVIQRHLITDIVLIRMIVVDRITNHRTAKKSMFFLYYLTITSLEKSCFRFRFETHVVNVKNNG